MSKYVVLVSGEDSGVEQIVYQERGVPGSSIANRPAIFKSRDGAEEFAEYMAGKFLKSSYRVVKANVFP